SSSSSSHSSPPSPSGCRAVAATVPRAASRRPIGATSVARATDVPDNVSGSRAPPRRDIAYEPRPSDRPPTAEYTRPQCGTKFDAGYRNIAESSLHLEPTTMSITFTRDDVREGLKSVYDPEIGINIVDLGLVYDADVSEQGDVLVTMTLT